MSGWTVGPPGEAPLNHDGDDAPGSELPTWFPTRGEGLGGALVGATIGALIFAAVALDLQDFTPPRATPARTGHFLVAAARNIEVTPPETAPRRATRASAEAEPSVKRAGAASGARRSARR